MLQVFLRELQVEAAVGILDWELAQTQRLILSCEAQINGSLVVASDSVADTLSYAQLRDVILSFCSSRRFAMLETLAAKLADHLFETFPMALSLRLEVVKPTIFEDAKGAGVELLVQR